MFCDLILFIFSYCITEISPCQKIQAASFFRMIKFSSAAYICLPSEVLPTKDVTYRLPPCPCQCMHTFSIFCIPLLHFPHPSHFSPPLHPPSLSLMTNDSYSHIALRFLRTTLFRDKRRLCTPITWNLHSSSSLLI